MDNGWRMSETVPALCKGMVQVWRIRLDGPERLRVLDEAYALLNADERARAARMRSVARREDFVAGRGNLRRLLGAVLGVDAAGLEFENGEHGKPGLRKGNYGDSGFARMTALSMAVSMDEVEFNLAHSGGVLLIALSRAGAVGVDVEKLNSEIEAVEVARTAFHADDVARVETAEDQVAEFYRCWTRREAVGKADGRGLLKPVDGEEGYFVREIAVGDGFAGAVATREIAERWLFLERPGLI